MNDQAVHKAHEQGRNTKKKKKTHTKQSKIKNTRNYIWCLMLHSMDAINETELWLMFVKHKRMIRCAIRMHNAKKNK